MALAREAARNDFGDGTTLDDTLENTEEYTDGSPRTGDDGGEGASSRSAITGHSEASRGQWSDRVARLRASTEVS
jgi:hypothetical protein